VAKVIHGPIVSEARGKIGDTVFIRSRGGSVARALSLAAGGAGPHNLLSVTHPDTGPASPPPRGSIITGQEVATVWKELALGAAGEFLGSDGADALWCTLPPPAYPGTGAIAISQAARPATLNLSAEGTTDWFTMATEATRQPQKSPGNLHRKILGGWLADNFDWVVAGGTIFSQASSIALTTTLGDDVGSPVLTAWAIDFGLWTSSAVLTGMGFCFMAPASTIQKTLKIYCSCFSAKITLTCRMSDGSVADTTDTFESAPGAEAKVQWNVVYKSARDGAHLLVEVQITTNKGSSPNIKFAAATLA
jgi:hypothetical protein